MLVFQGVNHLSVLFHVNGTGTLITCSPVQIFDIATAKNCIDVYVTLIKIVCWNQVLLLLPSVIVYLL